MLVFTVHGIIYDIINDMNKLNLGCGLKKLEGYINVDNRAECQPEVVCDLNIFPYPFPDSYFSEILLDHVIEHLNDPLDVLQELYRISTSGAKIIINCPHFSGNWVHPGHKSAISVHLFDFLSNQYGEQYGNCNFKVDLLKLHWFRNTKNGKRSGFVFLFLNKIINFLANLSPSAAERLWCYWVGGFEEISFRVTVIK